jgi:hypothetical protein
MIGFLIFMRKPLVHFGFYCYNHVEKCLHNHYHNKPQKTTQIKKAKNSPNLAQKTFNTTKKKLENHRY